MLRRSKLWAATAAAAAIAAIVPAQPGGAMAPCQVKPLFSVIEYSQVVAITGVYAAPAGAVDVELTCGVVRSGVTYSPTTDPLFGPVAALATTATVPAGSVSACYEVVVRYVGYSTYGGGCP